MKDGVGDQVEFVTEDIPHFFTETAPWLVDLRNGAVPTLGHHLGEAVGCQLGKTPEDFVNDVKSGARNAADVAAVLDAIRAQDFRGLTAHQREIAIAANRLLADIFAAAGRDLTSSQAEAVGHLAGTLIADFVVDSIVVGATGGVGAPKIALTLIRRIDNAPAAIRKILYPLRKGFEAGGELRKKLDRLLRTVRKSPDCKRPHAKRPGSRPNPDGHAPKGALRVASEGGRFVRASSVRTIGRGEKVQDLIQEVAERTYKSGGLEHAIVSLKDGTRVIVQGGKSGIDFGDLPIRRVILHTHPSPTGPSKIDFDMLDQLGQKSSYIYELFGGGLTKFGR